MNLHVHDIIWIQLVSSLEICSKVMLTFPGPHMPELHPNFDPMSEFSAINVQEFQLNIISQSPLETT